MEQYLLEKVKEKYVAKLIIKYMNYNYCEDCNNYFNKHDEFYHYCNVCNNFSCDYCKKPFNYIKLYNMYICSNENCMNLYKYDFENYLLIKLNVKLSKIIMKYLDYYTTRCGKSDYCLCCENCECEISDSYLSNNSIAFCDKICEITYIYKCTYCDNENKNKYNYRYCGRHRDIYCVDCIEHHSYICGCGWY